MNRLYRISLAGIFALLPILVTGFAQETSPAIIIKDGAIEIETFIYGNGSETLIIAAGNGRPAADLTDLAKRIASSGIQVVTYNYRTIGKSKGPISSITLHDFAQDVWRIADALGVRKVHLAGKTFGNRVMRTASADKPGRVLSVILIGAGGEILPLIEVQKKYKRYIDPNLPKDEWVKLQSELMFAPSNRHLASKSAEHGKYPKLAGAQVDASNATPENEWATGGTAPMLVLTCLQDLVAVPENGLSIAKRRPDTWLIGIPNCGHNMVFEKPEVLRKQIVEFIQSGIMR
jgi:pimeloyl-ACP methyl ester carboxylesterase